MTLFKLILADPPWAYRDKCVAGQRGAALKHGELNLPALCALPVDAVAARDCALALWVTNPLLPEGLRLLAAWGFTYKTVLFHWRKVTKGGNPAWGMGHWSRSNLELCLLGTRGRPQRLSAGVHAEVSAPRLPRPSEKPPQAHERLAALFGDVPRLELFARETVPGWVALGDEIDGRDIRESLWDLALDAGKIRPALRDQIRARDAKEEA